MPASCTMNGVEKYMCIYIEIYRYIYRYKPKIHISVLNTKNSYVCVKYVCI